ncbi:MAG: hypothetical protein JETT_1763 [Candidatus Jettenia ecosi]|uniref:Uncharacterized protein n=1 Tax=Candidatus Jettenia ecosi TaxID=2494326 RepID=A0A533QB91_9BACT|nr:MAG: hypothetical protein JETT_1763 [Candidatus Jettenia ecosi]
MNFLELKPVTNSLLAFGLLGIGSIGALFILALIGRTNPPKNPNFFRWAHRITGYIFFAFYLFIATIMFKKFGEFTFLPPKATIHAYVGISIFAMIIIKICIVRFYRKFYSSLPIYGILIILAVYLQIPLYAGYDIFSAIMGKYTTLSEKKKLAWTQVQGRQKAIGQECAINSSQEKNCSSPKTGDRWQNHISSIYARYPEITGSSEVLPTSGHSIENLEISGRKIKARMENWISLWE